MFVVQQHRVEPCCGMLKSIHSIFEKYKPHRSPTILRAYPADILKQA